MIRPRLKRLKDIAYFLYVQRIKGFSAPGDPHLDPETAAALRELLAGSSFYLEFGSGGSTLLADRLGVPTVCVDSDRYFADVVRRSLSAGTRVTVLHANIGLTEAWGLPLNRRAPWRARLWRRYIARPFQEIAKRTGFPDLIFVDGRFRVACVLESVRQAQLRGARTTILVDDYDMRPAYHVVEQHLGAPERIGRSALFRIDPAAVPPIAEAIVAAAIMDPA